MTNAEKIRNMTGAELAMLIMCPKDMANFTGACADETCKGCVEKWLKEEVVEDGREV